MGKPSKPYDHGVVHIAPGQVFDKLTVVCRYGTNRKRQATWLCWCECGNFTIGIGNKLRRGEKRSCGCLAYVPTPPVKHGMWKSSEYRTWIGIIVRCENPNDAAYENYGGRGIVICDQWRKDFARFYEDMGPKPTPKHTIERLDVNGPYSPENCVWATRKEQNRNKRNSHKITHNGITMILADWAVQFNLTFGCLKYRVSVGWDFSRAISTPSSRPTTRLP